MFIKRIILSNKKISFSQWSRKAYASFVSIGKVIKISVLKTKAAQSFIKKSENFSGYGININSFYFNNNFRLISLLFNKFVKVIQVYHSKFYLSNINNITYNYRSVK